MPIQYSNPINPYVNRGSVEVAKLLSSKFANNFQFADQLQDSLANLQVADFEGDLAAKMQLEQRTRQELEGFSARGDYENLMVPITRSAQQFAKDYTPLAQNYKLYEEAKKIEQERVMRGDVTQDQYENWMRRSKYINDPTTGDLGTYRGVKFNADGSADNSSYFAHIPIARAVNVDEEILKAINTLDPEKRGGRSATNFVQGQDGIRYVVDSEGEIIEQVTPDRVAAVTRQVLDRSDVRSYLEQEADFGTFESTPEELQMILSQRLETISGKPSHTQHTQELRTVLQSGNVGQMRQMAKKVLQDQDAERYMDMAIRAGATTSRYGGGSRQRIDSDYYSYLKDTTPAPQPTTPVITGEPQKVASAAVKDGRVTPDNIEKAKADGSTQIQTQAQLFAQKHPEVWRVTPPNISTYSDRRIIAEYGKYGKEAVQDLIAFKNLQRQVGVKLEALDQLETQAKQQSGYTLQNAVKAMLVEAATDNGIQASELGDQIVSTISSRYNVNQEDAIRMYAENFLSGVKSPQRLPTEESALMSAYVGYQFKEGIRSEISEREALSVVLQDVFNLDSAQASKIANSTQAKNHNLDTSSSLSYNNIARTYGGLRDGYVQLLNNSAQSEIAFNVSESMFGDGSKDKAVSSTLVKTLKSSAPESFSGLTDRVTGEPVSEILGGGAYTIDDVKFTHAILPDYTIASNAVQMTFKPASGTEGGNKVVILPYEEVVSEYNVNTSAGPIDANAITLQQYPNRILSEVYTHKINNPLTPSVTINRDFSSGNLSSEFIFQDSEKGGVKFPQIVGVTSTYTDINGRRNQNTLSLQDWMDSYLDNLTTGVFEE